MAAKNQPTYDKRVSPYGYQEEPANIQEERFYNYINALLETHKLLVDLYTNTLYEDTWTDSVVKYFHELLINYNIQYERIKKLMKEHVWQNQENKRKFDNMFNGYLHDDYIAYNMAAIRHETYINYRTKRKSIIIFLNNAIHIVQNSQGKNYTGIFTFFNDLCAKVPLYDNRNLNNEITVHKTPVLLRYLHNNPDVFDTVRQQFNGVKKYTNDEILIVFKGYIKCRLAAYAIFNMLTSVDEINGYNKYHNFLYSYINGECDKKVLKQLYQSTLDENDFMPSDDYQQILDEYAWNSRGIYESYGAGNFWTLFNPVEQREKGEVKKIRPVGRKANQCKIKSDGLSVYAATDFYPGDIIEICPTRDIAKNSLYTKEVRDIVFEVVRNERYVIPFGYCLYYNIADQWHEANCDYLWDPNKNVIVIKALVKIQRDTKLFLNIITPMH